MDTFLSLLRTSRERTFLRSLRDHPLPVFIYEQDTFAILFVNEAAAKQYGYSRKKLLRMKMTDLLAKAEVSRFRKAARQKIRRIQTLRHWRHRKKNGAVVNVEVTTHAITVGNRAAVLAIVSDAEEKARLYEELVRRESQLRATLYGIGDGVIATDRTGAITMMNPVAEKLTGWNEREAVGLKLERVFRIKSEVTGKKAVNPVKRVLREGIVVGLANHTLLVTRNGTVCPIADAGAPVFNAAGEITGVVLVFRDQTAERNAQRALQAARDFAESIIATIREPLLVLDERLEVVAANRSFYRVFAVEPRETIGRKVYHLGNRQWDIPKLRTLLEDILPSNSHFDDFEVTHEFEHIGTRTMLLNARRLVRESNRSKLILLAIEDVTERKKAEESLKQSEQQYRQLFESASDAIVIFEPAEEIILDVNRRACDLYGFTREELIGRSLKSISQDVSWGEERIREVLSRGSMLNFETVHYRKDGRELSLLVNGSVIDYGGKKAIMSIHRDVTEWKQALRALSESEERYRALFEQAQVPIYLADPSTRRVLYANDAFLNLLQYQREEAFTLTVYDFIAHEKGSIDAYYERAMREGSVSIGPRQWRKRDGTLAVVDVVVMRLRYSGRDLFCGMGIDITERRRTEEELERNRALLSSIFEASRDGIILEDEEETIIYVNTSFANIYGYDSPSELIGKHISIVLADGENEFILEYGRKRLRGDPAPSLYEFRSKRKDGQIIHLEVSVAVADIGSKKHIISVIRDISERKRAELERAQLEQQLYQAQKLESIGTLASGIAHDFNNILSIIMGHASMLERVAREPEKLTKSTNAIIKATERGASLVSQILTFAHKTETLVEPLNLNLLVEEVGKMLQETFPKTIEFRIELEQSLPLIIADATQIHQVVLNLCVNARDAMPRGGTLVVSTARVNGESLSARFPSITAREYAALFVSDTGVGMDKQVSERIFEPFFSTKAPGQGTGLGLSVVHGIVLSHGGVIDFVTEPGKGTTFFVYFPLPEEPIQKMDTQTRTQEPARGGSETILLIEDEELLREMVTTLLRSEGYRVLTAANGEEGVALYEQQMEMIDLVLSDLGLPKMSGAEVVGRLRALNPQARVVIASGYFEPQQRAELMQLGTAQFLSKPYQGNAILRVVRDVLDSKT